MRIYISGQITGLEHEVAKMYFKTVQDILESKGHIVINPFEVSPYTKEKTWHDYMGDCLKAILYCEGMYMLENWRNSKGARIEHDVAVGLNIPIFYSKNHDLF